MDTLAVERGCGLSSSEREKERAGEGQRDGGRENPRQAPCCQRRDHDMSRDQELDSQLSHPGSSFSQCLKFLDF